MAESFFYHALIRTHHITSRKKVATLKSATKKLNCHAILRSGGVPGIMFVEGRERIQVEQWVDVVHSLRYKAYELTSPVTATRVTTTATATSSTPSSMRESDLGCLEELDTVREMGAVMESRGLMEWWRQAMGYTKT